ncbi:SDR family oxidoreductase [Populibacterium corticicola]|uniref:SDR family oxidoreductase n=1 Tax=Populibacterium corticicola TaxID=1812826 RepID=A0ABW5XJT1_9MICO
MRTIVITGGISGIGKALADTIRVAGDKVITVDLKDADVNVDLTTAEGREALVEQVRELSGGKIDGIVANAGLAAPVAATIGVNYFGAIATLEGLRPLLADSDAPRAALTTSMASLHPNDEKLVDLCLAGDEEGALARAEELAADPQTGGLIYGSSKAAIARWIRRVAPTAEWAGGNIPLNGVGPGVVFTPMTADLTATQEAREGLLEMVPMPLNGFMEAQVVADVLDFLISRKNTHLCGQVIFVDGGSDAVIRGDSTW